jgi:5'-nucleotidase
MAYELKDRLVIGLASSALFNLDESDKVFQKLGEDAYRKYQRKHQDKVLEKGVAYPFIKRLLSLNEIDPENPLVEVVLLSKNDPDTGLRVMNSIEHYGLSMTRALFLQGGKPHKYIKALDISLFLSAHEEDVKEAISNGASAGQVLDSQINDDEDDKELRISFDFDGVIADDTSESVYAKDGIDSFLEHEKKMANVPVNAGPLQEFLQKISIIQKRELKYKEKDKAYEPKLKVSIVTARSAPSHERVINTMRTWEIMVNEAFFLGGIEKKKVLEVLNPHIFFDDQKLHLEKSSDVLPSVHIPFGIRNL